MQRQRAEGHPDGDVVVRPVHDGDRVTGHDPPRDEYPQIRARCRLCGEAFDPALLGHPLREGVARDARVGDLEFDVVADPPPLADQGTGHVDAFGGEVFAEGTAAQRSAEGGGPGVEVFPRVGVHRLVRPAVMLRAHAPSP